MYSSYVAMWHNLFTLLNFGFSWCHCSNPFYFAFKALNLLNYTTPLKENVLSFKTPIANNLVIILVKSEQVSHWFSIRGKERETATCVDSHMKRLEMLIISLRGINKGCRSHLGCSRPNTTTVLMTISLLCPAGLSLFRRRSSLQDACFWWQR